MKDFLKRAVLALWLAALAFSLGGCVNQISEREMADLSASPIEAVVDAPYEDSMAAKEEWVTLYFLDEDGSALLPMIRKITAEGGVSCAQAALEALLQGPVQGERGASWPDLGASRSDRLLEVSAGVATVDLPAHARTLPQETLYAIRMAIANTLTEFSDISYVNVLVGGREEGLDLGATLPVGTFTRVDELDAASRYSRLLKQRLSGEGVKLLTTLYFPTADGRMVLPEVRNVAYAQVSPIEYLYTLLGELGKGASLELCAREVPPPLEYIKEMPEIVRTEDGYLAIELCFDQELEEELAHSGMTLGVYLAMLSDTLMGFVPGVEGLKVSVGEWDVTALEAEQTPDGRGIVFEQGLVTRSDFTGYAGAPVTLYAMEGDGLVRVQHVVAQTQAYSARMRLAALMELEGRYALPQGLFETDILAVCEGTDMIAVNLSSQFAQKIKSAGAQRERASVYAMVNTLTEGTDIARVFFFFEGEQVEALAGALEMRGSFTRNPGMVVN